MDQYFKYDNRLGISVPIIEEDWGDLESHEQELILSKWEKIRGSITDRIKDLEGQIRIKLEEMNDTLDFMKACELNTHIAELASTINDLWLWYRTNENVSPKNHF